MPEARFEVQTPETNFQVGPLVCGRWRLESLIGQGGMSDVYRAVDEASDRVVAVKIVRSADPSLARRLAQEAKALEGFDHPGLVRLLDCGVQAEQAFLVMELVDGPTLAARLRRGGLSPSRTATLGATLSDALAYVHERGIVHRDLKPPNVLLGPGVRVRLADFGIARLLDASALTVTGTTLGTAAYMAPEQIGDHSVGTGADVWSLGLILLECLTGKRAFNGTPAEVVARRLAGPVAVPGDLPTPWRLLLGGMLDDDAGRRPAAAEVAGMLSSPAFAAPWTPVAEGRAHDPLALDGRAQERDTTLAAPLDPTLVAPSGAESPSSRSGSGSSSRSRRRRLRYVIPAAVLVAIAAAIAAWELSTTNTSANSPPRDSAPPTTSSSTTTSTTTTTTVPSVGATAATLVSDVQSGIADGSISQDAGNSVQHALDQLLSAYNDGNAGHLTSALGNLDASIADGASSGKITPDAASTLTADVASLTSVLGVSTSTTTAPSPASAPGSTPGPGGGPGQDTGSPGDH